MGFWKNALFCGALTLSPFFGGCDDEGGEENESPVIYAVPDQTVDEGGSLGLNLNDYVSDPDGDAVTLEKISGPGSISGGVFEYQDATDADNLDNEHTVQFRATDGYGGEATGSFLITQNDISSIIRPVFFNTKVNWISYAPTNFNPNMLQFPDEASVRADLQVLRNANFKGLVTYGSDNILGSLPRIAKEEGFDYVVMGVWDFNNQEEWDNAIAQAEFADAYCLGNEGISAGRYTLVDIEPKMNELRNATGKPVTTTEPVSLYDSALLSVGDWIFPNVHPYWAGVKDPSTAATWTRQQYEDLVAEKASLGVDSMVVMKEVGLPTGGEAGLSEANQNSYYRSLEDLTSNYSAVTFVYFEAFDQPWKDWAPVEPHWGLFRQDRSAKEASKPQVIFTYVPPVGSYLNLKGKTVNVKPEDYQISAYINVDGVWWMKPTWANPLTAINQYAAWQTDITTGGNDGQATAVFAALVTPTYSPVRNTLPRITDPKVIAIAQQAK